MRKHPFRPFSHKAGVEVLFPQTNTTLHIFPTKLVVNTLTFEFPSVGFVREFSVFLDIEKRSIEIRGKGESYFSYTIIEKKQSLFFCDGHCEKLIIESIAVFDKQPSSRIEFGYHGKQEIEEIYRKKNLAALLPFWHRLGEYYPSYLIEDPKHRSALLGTLADLIAAKNREQLYALLEKVVFSLCRDLFIIDNQDPLCRGYVEKASPYITPAAMLRYGADIIESMLFLSSKEAVEILPALPPQFQSGDFQKEDNRFSLALRWRKCRPFQLIITPKTDIELNLILPNEIQGAYVSSSKEKLRKKVTFPSVERLYKGVSYTFDRFFT